MINVAVTGLNSFFGAPGIGVVRCLREAPEKLRIIGLDYSPFSPGLTDESVDESFLIEKGSFLDKLGKIAKKIGSYVLIPCLDSEIVYLSRYRDRIMNIGVKTLIPQFNIVKKVKDKVSQALFLEEKGIVHPRSIFQIPKNFVDLRFPLLVKSEFGVVPVFSKDELKVVYRRMKKTSRRILIQEYIRGEEYSICILAYPKGEIRQYVMQRKLVLSDFGSTLMGVTVENEKILSISKDIVGELGWIGPMEIEFRGKKNFFVTDINLRFPAWIYLSAAAGVNLPYYVILLATGRGVPESRQRTGVVLIRDVRDRYLDIFKLFKFFREFSIPEL
ncbi:MAG: hypothetical protein DSO07_09770 [Thermoproteota archaeon]|jgi:carbamoyl-phosphate synthase large subunit|uniref:ATP-grasp domain-containing protein n=1 Tax=Candidatus Methanodesulfokora washburnensis TaxID=2478471 RepID=A0A429GPI5_9CREN|nr:ATP-grasp domain-containing protein [Candidatus Methanodesulfokores washburnensis]RSN75768.1 hypothetical protein D6D85_05555 [Candidatus Methanodesulfokores washburnensis]RZN59999.1 MAG: hypothetical protein EF810_06330 [Candidatus Methanodesulfokores washburnensis]TDA39926.1 MAG: hypothetical protein DSO07_09770 [Candidatus Korarchaeota archaeon]